MRNNNYNSKLGDNSEFFAQYKDPRWQKKRLEIMQRDHFMCQNCNETTKELNVHHKFYEYNRKVWEYSDSELITLCKDCHEIWGAYTSAVNQFTHVLLMSNWSPMQIQKLLDKIMLIHNVIRCTPYDIDALIDTLEFGLLKWEKENCGIRFNLENYHE
jgi:hypothetical protein